MFPVKLDQVVLHDPKNGRLETDPDKVRELADSIQDGGLLNPITVRRAGPDYQLIAGRNRLAAFRLLNRPYIPARIIACDDLTAGTLRLAENTNRADLSPVEEAKQLSELVPQHPEGVDGVAHALGRSITWVLDRLDMAQWDDDLLAAVHARKISIAAAKQLARVADPDTRAYLVAQAATHGVTATTAAYWRQQADTQALTSPTSSEIEVEIREKGPKPKMVIDCWLCSETPPLTSTVPVSVCLDCFSKVRDAKQETAHTPAA